MGRQMTKIRLRYVREYRDNRGTVRRYVRIKGRPEVALPGLPGSKEFMEVYQRETDSHRPLARQERIVSGTCADLVTRFYGSAEFRNLSASSKKTYRHVLERFVTKDGHRGVANMPAAAGRKIIEEIGATKPAMANLTRSILVTLFEFAISVELRTDNPFKRIKPYKMGTRHTWTDAELDAYRARWPLGTRERLAFSLLLYSGQRVSDAVKLKRSDVLSFAQQKTGRAMSIPAHPALVRAIKAGPSKGVCIIGDPDGRPINSDALTKLIRRAVAEAGLPDRCKAHGLRKAIQRMLAERGGTLKQMQAISGHKTLRESERYSEAANQSILASMAIALLPDEE